MKTLTEGLTEKKNNENVQFIEIKIPTQNTLAQYYLYYSYLGIKWAIECRTQLSSPLATQKRWNFKRPSTSYITIITVEGLQDIFPRDWPAMPGFVN